MSGFDHPARQLPLRPDYDDFERQASGSVSAAHIFGVLRRRYRLVRSLTLLGVIAGA
jgi:hypothetical protein